LISGHFVPGPHGRLFVLRRQPDGPVRGTVVVIPPFAEEMNKSRRMVTLATTRLTAAGYDTVLPDLFGTGDSNGDFSDATWPGWQEDIRTFVDWLQCPSVELLAIRLGAALALECVSRNLVPVPVKRVVLWQPVFDGNRYIRQFQRLRTAATLIGNEATGEQADAHADWLAGKAVSIAGYSVGPNLALPLIESIAPHVLPPAFGDVHWFEVVRSPVNEALQGTSERLIAASRVSGARIESAAIVGQPFWASTEIAVIPELVDRTVAAFGATS
jgi:exosortase A-associated hydrolase 2